MLPPAFAARTITSSDRAIEKHEGLRSSANDPLSFDAMFAHFQHHLADLLGRMTIGSGGSHALVGSPRPQLQRGPDSLPQGCRRPLGSDEASFAVSDHVRCDAHARGNNWRAACQCFCDDEPQAFMGRGDHADIGAVIKGRQLVVVYLTKKNDASYQIKVAYLGLQNFPLFAIANYD